MFRYCIKSLQGIYNLLGLKRNAKSTDLKNWYEINVITKTINGKSTACITIIRDMVVDMMHIMKRERKP